MLLELAEDPPLLQLVHLDHRVQQLEVVAGVRGELLERDAVLRETTAAPADPRAEKVRAEPVVEPDALRDLDHVGTGRLADVRDLVDEADPRHQERVRGELDHLRGGDVRAHDRRIEPLVERGHDLAVGLCERADDHAVRLHEVLDRAPLREELRVGDVADVREPARVERRTHLLPGADRDGALHHEQRPLVGGGQLVDDPPDGAQIGIAGVRGRRPDTDEEDAAFSQVLHLDGEGEPFAVLRQQFLDPGLVERHTSGLERLDPLRKDVADDHVVAELGEARAGDEPDPARPENPDLHGHDRHGPEPSASSAAARARSPASSRSRAS